MSMSASARQITDLTGKEEYTDLYAQKVVSQTTAEEARLAPPSDPDVGHGPLTLVPSAPSGAGLPSGT